MFIEFTPEVVAGIVGVILSWLFGWFPGLNTWYAALKSEVKSGIMLGLLALVSVGVYLLAFYGVLQTAEPITVWNLLTVFFAATVLNQTAYMITPQAQVVKTIKTETIVEEIEGVKPNATIIEEGRG